MTRTTTNLFDDDHLYEECATFGIYGSSEANSDAEPYEKIVSHGNSR